MRTSRHFLPPNFSNKITKVPRRGLARWRSRSLPPSIHLPTNQPTTRSLNHIVRSLIHLVEPLLGMRKKITRRGRWQFYNFFPSKLRTLLWLFKDSRRKLPEIRCYYWGARQAGSSFEKKPFLNKQSSGFILSSFDQVVKASQLFVWVVDTIRSMIEKYPFWWYDERRKWKADTNRSCERRRRNSQAWLSLIQLWE